MTFFKQNVRADSLQLAMETAYRILKVRSRSESEVAARLADKGIEPELIEKTIAALKTQGYLDDAKLAAELAEKYRGSGESDAKIRERLLQRGLNEKLADSVLSAIKISGDGQIWQALQKRAKTLKNAAPALQIRRLTGYLARQGYEPDAIELAMEKFIAESNFNEEE